MLPLFPPKSPPERHKARHQWVEVALLSVLARSEARLFLPLPSKPNSVETLRDSLPSGGVDRLEDRAAVPKDQSQLDFLQRESGVLGRVKTGGEAFVWVFR